MSELLHEMRTYAAHLPSCAYQPTYPEAPDATCDCGFDAVLERYDAVSAGFPDSGAPTDSPRYVVELDNSHLLDRAHHPACIFRSHLPTVPCIGYEGAWSVHVLETNRKPAPTPEERAEFKRSELAAARALFAPKAPIVDLFEEVRRWVASIGSTNLDTGRRITKADALLVIDGVFKDLR